MSVGIVRPSDLEEILEAAALYSIEESSTQLLKAENRLHEIAVEKLGQEWVD